MSTMTKEEARKEVVGMYSDPGYSYVKQEDRELEFKFHDLLVDILTDKAATERLVAMFKDDELVQAATNAVAGDFELMLDFEHNLIHYSILDDGELHVIYDPDSGNWFLDQTYDFYDYAEGLCEKLGVDVNKVEVAGIDGWRRNGPCQLADDVTAKKLGLENIKVFTLGLEDLYTILEAVKSGDMSKLREKLPLASLKTRLAYYFSD